MARCSYAKSSCCSSAKSLLTHTLCGLFLCLSFSIQLWAEAEPASFVPQGFEHLLEKQTTAIDVFYGGTFIATTLAEYTPSTIEFLDSQVVVDALDNLINPIEVADALSGELDSNIASICLFAADTECGLLAPDVAAVIFDEGRFRADVFINANYVSVQQRAFNKFLPSPMTDISYINNFSAVYSGSDKGESSFSLSNISLLGKGNRYLEANWFIGERDNDTDIVVSELFGVQEDNGKEIRVGWLESEARFITFANSRSIFGASYATSYKARTDLQFATGTPIQLFFPTRSRVDVYRGSKILSSAFYAAGNHVIDTGRLPDGAYDIEIIVTGANGAQETFTRFFVKTPRLAPQDEDLYFITAGNIYNKESIELPDDLKDPLIQGGYSTRLHTDLGLTASASMTNNDVVVEGGLYYLQPLFDVEPKLMLGVRGDYGMSIRTYARYRDLSSSIGYERVWSDYKDDSFRLIAADRTAHSLSLSHPIYNYQASFRYSLNKSSRSDTSENYGLRISGVLAEDLYNGRLQFFSEIAKSKQQYSLNLGVEWRFIDGDFRHTPKVDFRYQNPKDDDSSADLVASYRGNWKYKNKYHDDLLLNWQTEVGGDVTSLVAGADYYSEYGGGKVSVGHFRDDNIAITQYSAEFNSSIAGENNVMGFGGSRSASSAIIVEVDGSVEEIFDVYVNQINTLTVKSGEKIVVPLASYQQYDIQLKDRGMGFVEVLDPYQQVTLYPGNVKHIKWSAKKIGIIIATIVRKIPGCIGYGEDACKEPLVYTRAEGVSGYAATGPSGFIQAEVYEGETQLVMVRKNFRCTVNLPEFTFDNGIAYFDEELWCEPQ